MANVLLVDDHPAMREVIGQMLEIHGHQVGLADSAEAAWDQMQLATPDVVVVDQRLPGWSGLDLLQKMQGDATLRSVTCILCSGDDIDQDAAIAVGASDFWLKGSPTMFERVGRLTELIASKKIDAEML